MILQILGLSCLGVLWINSEPTIRLRLLYKKDDLFSRLINCCMCSTFWIALLCSQNLYIAAVCSILAEFICRKLNSGSL
jgi:hypothetical protein